MLLVRDALPEVRSHTLSDRWDLGAEARPAARDLRGWSPDDCHFVSSAEPKAVQTLRELSAEVARPRV